MQLRWLIKTKTKHLADHTVRTDVRVLQFRTRVYAPHGIPMPPGLAKLGITLPAHTKIWSEWADVPDVPE